MGYLRFKPGPSLQRLTYYAWDTGLTRYFNERLGITVDGRGYYGTAYVGLNPKPTFTRPAISQYDVHGRPHLPLLCCSPNTPSPPASWAAGPTATSPATPTASAPRLLGLYPDGNTFAISASVIGEFNLTPNVALRLAPEYFFTGFGSSLQNSLGFTGGLVYRFGKQ